MRVTQSMYYDSLYGTSNSNLSNRLFDVNKQIASGLKIQYASDDIAVFTETMRLDNEITTLNQIKQSTESGYKVSDQTDVILNDFEDTANRFRTLLVSAGNGVNSETSMDAIALELRGLEEHFKDLANTSINGQYLFSGSAVDVRPISDDGSYNGNDAVLNAFLGSNSTQQYNLSGADLFLGEEVSTQRQITSNVVQESNVGDTLDGNTIMADFMGTVPAGHEHNFYVRGVQSDGTAFNSQIQLSNDDTVDTLLEKIGNEYGNTPSLDVVNVTMNDSGQIVIEDKLRGSSKLDFHMVGASDFGGTDEADISTFSSNIDDLQANGGLTDYDAALVSANQLYVREFNKSPYSIADGTSTSLDGRIYDRTEFTQDGPTLSSSIPQIVKDDNSFAIPSTKISEVADLSQGTAGELDGTQFLLEGTDINGTNFVPAFQINLSNDPLVGSTYSFDGGTTNYNIYNADSARSVVLADDMTYQQYMDVVNIAMNGNPPAANTSAAYDVAIESANNASSTYLEDGKIQFTDKGASSTQASISMYDSNSGNFGGDSSVMSFNSNNALTIRDPKTDFFKTIDDMIKSVEEYKSYPDSSSGDMRSVGIENSIQMMDDLQDHIFRSHSVVGANSNTLTQSLERTSLLEMSTITLRSSVIDTDLAEASLELTQLNINYEAMLSTVGKVSQLSLVNYL